MSERGRFLVYCIEMYKKAKGSSGWKVYEYFERHGAIDYILDCYGALHTMGEQHIIDDIDRFIEIQKKSLA